MYLAQKGNIKQEDNIVYKAANKLKKMTTRKVGADISIIKKHILLAEVWVEAVQMQQLHMYALNKSLES